MATDTLALVLANSVALRLTGRFSDALKLLDEESLRPNVPALAQVLILREAARVRMTQGYPQAAKTYLKLAIECHRAQIDTEALFSLGVHLAYVTLVGCGETVDSELGSFLSKAKDVRQECQSSCDSTYIEVIAHSCKIEITYQTLCLREGDDSKKELVLLLRQLIHDAAEGGRYSDVYVLLSAFQGVEDRDNVDDFLEKTLLYAESIPSHIAAALAFERAKIASHTIRARRLDEADEAFKRCDHLYGSSEIRRLRIKHGLETTPNNLVSLIEIMTSYLEADYPNGVLSMAIDPLSLALSSGQVDLYTKIQEVLYNVCSTAGIHHERILLELQLLAALNQTTARYSTVIELATDIQHRASERQYWTVAFLAGQVKSLGLLQGGHPTEALKVAQEISSLCTREHLAVRATAEYHLAIVKSSQPFESSAALISHLTHTCNELDRSAQTDLRNSEPLLAGQKLCHKADLQLRITHELQKSEVATHSTALVEFTATIEQAYSASDLDGITPQERSTLKANCDEILVRRHLMAGDKRNDDEEELAGVEICSRLIQTYTELDMPMQLGVKYMMRAMCHQQRYQKEQHLQRQRSLLVTIEADLQLATQAFDSLGLLQLLITTRHALGRVYVAAWELCNVEPSDAFGQLCALEKSIDQRRRELSALGSLPALLEKQRLSSSTEVYNLYDWATGICIAIDEIDNLWVWGQKRKARSLADMIGLGILVPETVKSSLAADRESNELISALESYSSALLTATGSEKGYIRTRVSETEAALLRYPAFANFLQLRDGNISNVAQLASLAKADAHAASSSRAVFFIDWIAHRDALYLTIKNCSIPSRPLHITRLPITMSDIETWLTTYFTSPSAREDTLTTDSLRNPSKPLRKLDCVLGDIALLTRPDDLLVFCTTSALTSLPLHALKIHYDRLERDVHLIQRNPVVYAPSFPILNLCIARSLDERSQSNGKRSVFLGVYDKNAEAKRIYASLARLAEGTPSGQSYCGGEVTRKTFRSLVADAKVVHFHGHCRFEADNVLDQAIVLAQDGAVEKNDFTSTTENDTKDDEQLKSTSTLASILNTSRDLLSEPLDLPHLFPSQSETTATHFTIEDIFTLQLHSPLIVLIACSSSAQHISTGDEPMGLVASLLCSGAASVVGSLWRIPSKAGRVFSAQFYAELARAKGIVDLAVVMQRAIVSVMDYEEEDMSSVYFWGAFCLSGSWMLQGR